MEHIFQRKLEDSPGDGPGTHFTFTGNAETNAKRLFRPDFQRTRAICGLVAWTGARFVLLSLADIGLVQPQGNRLGSV